MEVRFPKLGKSEIIIFWDVTKRGKSVMYSSGLGTDLVRNTWKITESKRRIPVVFWLWIGLVVYHR